jgi:hypothetical protein
MFLYHIKNDILTKKKVNFGYTQVLFMGSVPRINCLLTIVPSKKKVNLNINIYKLYLYSDVDNKIYQYDQSE